MWIRCPPRDLNQCCTHNAVGQVSASKQRISELRAVIEQQRVQHALAGFAGCRPAGDLAAYGEEEAARNEIEQVRSLTGHCKA